MKKFILTIMMLSVFGFCVEPKKVEQPKPTPKKLNRQNLKVKKAPKK